MSNVLIGIIGVILFIGLALAGALFLGPRFQESSLNTKASVLMSHVSQVADAASLYGVTNGTPYPATILSSSNTDLVPAYLKSVPIHPIDPTFVYSTVTKTAMRTGDSYYSIAAMPSGDTGEKICQIIDRNYGMALDANGKAPLLTAIPDRPAGCFRITATMGQVNGAGVELYIAFKQV